MLVGVLGAILGVAIASALGVGGIDSFFTHRDVARRDPGIAAAPRGYEAVTGRRTKHEV
jgi:hypothetical protein